MPWSEADYAAYLRRQQGHPPAEPEGEFQARVRTLAHRLGYRTYHTRDSRGSDKGWFDLACARPGDRLILAELKRRGEKQTTEQLAWYEDLQRIQRVETYLWFPGDYDAIVEILTRRKVP